MVGTTAQRWELQRQFERANRLSSGVQSPSMPAGAPAPQNPLREATELYCQCVCQDPANLIYTKKMLGRLSSQRPRWWLFAHSAAWLRFGWMQAARRSRHWPKFLEHGTKALQADPWNRRVLLEMARVCRNREAAGAALLFLQQALTKHENDRSVVRLHAETLASLGRFEEAASAWRRLLCLRPNDVWARQMVAALSSPNADCEATQSIDQLTNAFEADPAGLLCALQLVDCLLAGNAFDRAEAVLHRARAAVGHDWRIEQKVGELTIGRLQRHAVVAQQYADLENTDAAQELVAQIGRELLLHEAAVFRQRCETQPNDAVSRLALARRLQNLGDYAAAADHFLQVRHSEPHIAEATLEEGECRQRLQQFDAAIECYRLAVATARQNQSEVLKRAVARLTVLENAIKLHP